MLRYLFLTAGLVLTLPAAQPPSVRRTQNVVNHRKSSIDLTFDVFRPARPNGIGIIFLINSGWVSDHSDIDSFPVPKQTLIDRGFTVFTVIHRSPPKFLIPEIVHDLHRAVRFIRHHAATYGVIPHRLGITGGSSGCHQSLLLATQGGPGYPQAPDPVDRESSALQAAACFYPPTDLLNFGRPGVDAVGVGAMREYHQAFGPQADSVDTRSILGRVISPYYFIPNGQPPILLIHGDADRIIPLQQSRIFVRRSGQVGAKAQLIVRHRAGHGWGSLGEDLAIVANWFRRYLQIGKK